MLVQPVQRCRARAGQNYPTVLPCDDVVAAFNLHIKSTCDQIIDNIHESKTLAQLRDTLLPKLMSGELRVSDIEKHAEGAKA